MKALWGAGQATVQEIREQLLPDRPLAYTTVMTVMDRLARKGVVVREKKGRAHLYSPSVGEDVIRDRALNHLIDNFFEGTHEQLLRYLSGSTAGSSGKMAANHQARVKVRRTPGRVPKEKETDTRMDASLL
jgi:predicted transcriptional regulator